MLRIFRGERHVEAAAQPGQHEQDAAPGASTDVAAQGTTTSPLGNGHSELGAVDPVSAAAATAQESVKPTLVQPHADNTTQGVEKPGHPAPAPREPTPQEPGSQEPAQQEPGGHAPAPQEPGFLDRGRMRRRARFLRAARELAYRDLGGLVFDLHRFGGRNDEVVTAKLDTLSRIDSELRILEAALRERTPVTVLRQAGVAACPRCAAIHGSGDRFCPACGLAVDQAERPIAGPNAPAPSHAPPPSTAWQPPSTAWQASSSVWQPSGAAPPPGSPPPIPGSPPPTPDHSPLPIPSASPAPTPNASPTPASSASPAPTPDASPIPDAPLPGGDANPTPPTAPTNVTSSGEPPEPQTEVIRSDASRHPAQQRTIAFDPVSPPPQQPDRASDSEQDRP